MLDIGLLRRDPDRVRSSARRRGIGEAFVDRVLELDARWRTALTDAETRKAEKNALTKSVAQAADKQAAAAELRPQIAALDAAIAGTETAAEALRAEIDEVLADVPNLLDPTVPDGSDAAHNREVRTWGTPPAFDFAPRPHDELAAALGVLDTERAGKIAGSRFAVLRGPGARLQRAISAFFLDRAARDGYVEIAPPYLVTRQTMWSTGQLSKFADQMYNDGGDAFLIPTAEVPLTALHSGEILEGADLPRRYCAATPCFRKEAGAAGKDTRGLIRQHQFEKVELVWITQPQSSLDDLERLTQSAAARLEELGIAHRVMLLCGGDTGFAAAKTYDIEVWLPGEGAYREISSCSNCTDFQARRAQIRYRPHAGAKPEFAHTLNGSGLAVGRTLIAVLENGQRADGGVTIPAALQPFCGFSSIEPDGTTR